VCPEELEKTGCGQTRGTIVSKGGAVRGEMALSPTHGRLVAGGFLRETALKEAG